MMRRYLLQACTIFWLSLGLLGAAQAQNVDGTLNKVETFLGYTDQAAPGQLPVSQAQFKQYRAVFKACVASNDADDVILCADAFLDTPAGKEVAKELPSWTPMALDIYMDIRNDDFWGLARDVGMLAACIGAQVITGGIDVCGVIKALVDMAKEAYATALAAYEFLSDLGSTVSKAAEAVYCLFSDCSGSGPPPEAVAWANFWHPRIPAGAAVMKSSGDPAQLDALSYSFINGEGLVLKVQNPKVYAALASTRGQFIDAVMLQWDAQMLNELIPALGKVRQAWLLPAKAQSNVKSGFTSSLPGGGIKEPWQMKNWRQQAGNNAGYFCRLAMSNARAMHVSRWVKDGRAAKLGSSEKGLTSDDLCAPHLALAEPLWDGTHAQMMSDLLLTSGCQLQAGKYVCDSVAMDASCDLAADYFKTGFACQVDWRKAVTKLMAQVGGCAAASGDQVYQCVTWPGQESCLSHFAKVGQIAAPHCLLDRTKADAHLAQLQVNQLSSQANACSWQAGNPTGQIVCPRDVQQLNCQALQTKPFHPAYLVHAVGCKLQRSPAYEAAVQQAVALRTAMAGGNLGAAAQTRSNSLALPMVQITSGGTVKWLPHPDPLLFIADLSTVTAQGLAQIDQLAKSKQPSFAGFAKCGGLGAQSTLSDKDGVDSATLCTQGQISAGQQQQQEIGEKLAGMKATLAPGQIMPGGGGPVMTGNPAMQGNPALQDVQLGNPATSGGLQVTGAVGVTVASGGLVAGSGGLTVVTPTAMPAMKAGASPVAGSGGAAPTQQVMSAPMPAPPGATPTRAATMPAPAPAPTPRAMQASDAVDPTLLRSLIAAGCRQAVPATPAAFTCITDTATASCESARRDFKVASCSRGR